MPEQRNDLPNLQLQDLPKRIFEYIQIVIPNFRIPFLVFSIHSHPYSLPNENILPWSKLKAFVDEKIHVTEKIKFVLRKVENFVGKGENAGYQHLLIFPQCFQKDSTRLKVGIMRKRVKMISKRVVNVVEKEENAQLAAMVFNPFPNTPF